MVIPQFSFFQGFEEVLQQALVASPWSTQIQGCSWCPNLINERLWPPQLCLQVAVKISEVFGSVGDFPCLSPLSCVCGCAHIRHLHWSRADKRRSKSLWASHGFDKILPVFYLSGCTNSSEKKTKFVCLCVALRDWHSLGNLGLYISPGRKMKFLGFISVHPWKNVSASWDCCGTAVTGLALGLCVSYQN